MTKEINSMKNVSLNEGLLSVVRKGNYDGMMGCLRQGADINCKDEFKDDALYHAVTNQHLPILLYLVENGASLNILTGLLM